MITLLEERLPDVSAEERAANEFARLIRKLRWMGMESGERQDATMQYRLPSRRNFARVAPYWFVGSVEGPFLRLPVERRP